MRSELQEGELAPDFEAPATSGGAMKRADLLGKTVVLYFFPRVRTPG